MSTELMKNGDGAAWRRVVPTADYETAKYVAASGLFKGMTNPAAVYTLMLLCEADGLHPIEAMRRYHIIQGVPSMRADAMQAEFQSRGGSIEWIRYDAEVAEAVFSHPKHCKKPITIRVTFEDCKTRGMTGADAWKKHAAAMLRARVISAGVRMVDPGIVVGIYAPEEMEQEPSEPEPERIPAPSRRTIDVTPTPPKPKPGIIDVSVLGWRSPSGGGEDTRSYPDVVKVAVAEAMLELQAFVRDSGLESINPKTIAPGMVHAHIFGLAVKEGYVADIPKESRTTAKAMQAITEHVYPSHRDWVRGEINSFLDRQREAAEDALIPAEAEPGDVEAEVAPF